MSAQRSLAPDLHLVVRPVAGGWLMECPEIYAPLAFRSGAKAEERARAMARTLTGVGYDVRLEIHDLQDQVAGAERYFADPWPAAR